MGPLERSLPPDVRQAVRGGVLGKLVFETEGKVHVGDLMVLRDVMMEVEIGRLLEGLTEAQVLP